MALTGQDFDEQVEIKTDRAYSDYFDPAKRQDIYKEALIVGARRMIAKQDKTETRDDLFSLVKTNVVQALTNNSVSLIVGGAGIADYLDVIEMKAKFEDFIDAVVLGATNTTPIKLSYIKRNNLRTGELINTTGATANTNVNGSRYVKVMTDKLVYLYSDVNLRNPVAGNGIYAGAAISQRFQYHLAKELKLAEKYLRLNEANINNPFYELSNTDLILHPLDRVCIEVTIDYYKYPTVFIDPNDNIIDLLASYGHNFMFLVMDVASELMGEYSRDTELAMDSEKRIMTQP